MRRAVGFLEDEFQVSERRACRAIGTPRSSCQYRPVRSEPTELMNRLRDLAARRPRYGYRRLHVLLRRDGFCMNHKRIWRLYRTEGLAVRRKKRRKLAAGLRVVLPPPTRPNQMWAADFMADSLATGRTFRTLNIIDCFTREAIGIEIDTSIPGERVVRVLDRVGEHRKLPEVVVVDNGPEFAGKALDRWAYEHGVKIHFIRPGKPVENSFIESFSDDEARSNGKFRDECLNESWFVNLADARREIESWRLDYNRARPHSSLGNLSPEQFAVKARLA
jgi:putative transposase